MRSLSLSDSIAAKWIQELETAIAAADPSKVIVCVQNDNCFLHNGQFYNSYYGLISYLIIQVTPLLWGLASLLGLCPGFQPIGIITGGQNSYIRTLFPLVVNSFEKVRR